jgi:hypothetical protein
MLSQNEPFDSRRSTGMPILELTFEGCVQDSEEYGSGPERMVSRVFFWIRRDGETLGDFRAELNDATGYRFFPEVVSSLPSSTQARFCTRR